MIGKDQKNNISVQFLYHGIPIRPTIRVDFKTNHYVVNELDSLDVNNQTVILIFLGQHFTTFPLEMYEERMMDIKRAVQRLHARSPGTLVVFKSANTRGHVIPEHYLMNSGWYVWTMDRSMRKMFADYPNIAFIDAWDITLAQNFIPSVHPNSRVLKNIIDNFLSYVCPIPSGRFHSHWLTLWMDLLKKCRTWIY